MKRSRFTETQIIAILNEADAGLSVKEICRKHGFSDATFYHWKSQLLKSAEGVFLTKAERRAAESGPSVKGLRAKIGQLTMENDFLEGALDRSHGASAK